MDADLVLEGGGPAALARTMFVDTFGVRPTDFDIDESIQDTLFKSGARPPTRSWPAGTSRSA